eukprot:5999510-Amphidinium_carterae.1
MGSKHHQDKWQQHLSNILVNELKFHQSRCGPNLFIGPSNNIMVLVYVGDRFITGRKEVGEEFIKNIRERLKLKHASPLTPTSSIEFLGKTISMDNHYNYFISYPESYYNKILKPLGLHKPNSNSLSTTSQKLTAASYDPTNTPLSSKDAETYRTTMGQP